jgi:hypothetical protein
MEAIAIPLRRLQEEASWFARAAEIKLLHVTADATLRGAAIKVLMAQEVHADNRALYFRFDDEVTGPAHGWPERAARLREQFADKAKSLEPAGIHLGALRDVSAAPGASARAPTAELAAQLFEARRALVEPLTQLVVVLAPTRVGDPERFAAELSSMVGARELDDVRWIVVETDGDAIGPLARELGRAALSCDCVVDGAAQGDALAAQGAAAVSDPVTVRPPSTSWRAPGAAPDVEPPLHAGAPPPASDEELRAAGLSPVFVKGGGEALKRLVLGAALAMRNKRQSDAVTLQARAAALCAEMEMPTEQVLNLHVLAGYCIAGQQGSRAREVYLQAGALAHTHGLKDLEAQTELALGMLDAVDRAPANAAAHYAAAGRLAEEAKIDVLAIEAWRMAGQLALEGRIETSAIDCWKRALDLADELDPKLAQSTSAPEIARALAAVYRKRGLVAPARALEERSLELEQGAPPAEAAPPKTAGSAG